MRVIAGQYKGRALVSARGTNIRPATDRVKETIFNILQHRVGLSGASVLDLFAGTGSLGIEALSRGAAHCTFVENAQESIRLLTKNLHSLGCEHRATVVCEDALQYVNHSREVFDLIFADPPYAFPHTGSIPEAIFGNSLLKKGGFLIIEHERTLDFPPSSLYELSLTKEFGQTAVRFFRHLSPISTQPR